MEKKRSGVGYAGVCNPFPRRHERTDKLKLSKSLGSLDMENKDTDTVIWLDECHDWSISSNVNLASRVCTKRFPSSQQLPWSIEEINLALYRLPAGPTAHSLILTIQDETLDNALEEMRSYNLSGLTLTDRELSISRFANRAVTKASLAAENDEAAAAISKPGFIFSKWPETCLLVSCWLRQYKLVKALLERGVDAKARDSDGRTPLHLAACSCSAEIIEELLKRDVDPGEWDHAKEHTALHCSAAVGDVASMSLLIKFGADVDAGLPGRSPLHYAVLSNVTECVKILLQAGANSNNQVYTGTPLHVAAGLDAVNIVRLLLSHGADFRVQCGTERYTPLHLAVENESHRCTKLLLDAGAPRDAQDSQGRTAMHLAALAQSGETLEHLIQAGANPNAEDNDGCTPLYSAVVTAIGNSELVRMLIQAGSDVNKPDRLGYMPLHLAALNRSSQVVILLLNEGADATAKTLMGKSALSFIIQNTPEVIPHLVARLDQAITLQVHEFGEVDSGLLLDFRVLVPGGPGEMDLISSLVEEGQQQVLEHPLCESFLHLKWLRIRKYLLFSFVFYAIFAAIFTAYILETFLYKNKTLGKVLFWSVRIFACLLTAKEIFQLAHGVLIYVKRPVNWLQCGVIVATWAVLDQSSDIWQIHVTAFGILLVWIELTVIIGRFPVFGLNVQMFTRVAKNVFNLFGAYISLIVGFSLSFCVLYHNSKSFKNPVVAFLKTIIMMSGELGFEDTILDANDKISDSGTLHLLLAVFVLLVVAVLGNLIIGLAVSDFQELRRSASLDKLVIRAKLVAHFERVLFSKLLDYAPQRIISACHQGALLLNPPHHCATHIRPTDPVENRLSRDLITAARRIVTERNNRNKYPSDFSNRSGYVRTQHKKCLENIGLRLEELSSRVEIVSREPDVQATV